MRLSTISFRAALKSDMDEVLTIFEDTIRNVCNKDYSSQQIDAWASSVDNTDKWEKRIETQYFLLAEIEKRLIGFGSLDEGGYLDLLYVHKDFQGRGVAGLLLEKLLVMARNKGYASVHTFASITALPFFESKGFVVVHSNTLKINNIELNNFKMVKPLF